MTKPAILDRARETATTRRGVFGWWGRSRTFLAQVKNEVERVTWPTWKEVQATTFVVILTSVLFGIYLWGIDIVLNTAVGSLFTAVGAS